MAASAPRVFVSHVAEDRGPALEVVGELERHGVRCWIAPRDIQPGTPYDDEIADAIEHSRAVLLIFSEKCNQSRYIRREITFAGESHKLVIPYRIEEAMPQRGLRVRLSDLHWIDAFAGREQAIEQVIGTLASHGELRKIAPDSAISTAAAPPRPEAEPSAPTPGKPAEPRSGGWPILIGLAAVVVVLAVLVTLSLSGVFRGGTSEPAVATSSPSAAPQPAPQLPAAPLRTLTGHSENVSSVAFSRDGKLLASGSYDDTVKLWEPATGKLLRTMTGHTRYVHSVAFSPDGRLLASGSDESGVRLWEASTGRLLRTLTGHNNGVNAVAFSPDGQLLASASYDNTIRLWDPATGQLARALTGHSFFVLAVAFSPSGQMLASGSFDKTIKLWDPSSGQLLRTLAGHGDAINAVAFSPDGRTLASASSDKTIKLWEAASGRLLRTLSGHGNSIYSVAFSPDGNILASGSRDKTVKLWNVAGGQLLGTLSGHDGLVFCVAFSPDGHVLASASEDHTIDLWDLSNMTTASR